MSTISIIKPNGSPSHSWPNIQTSITSTSIVANIACALLKTSLKTTLGVNTPIRTAKVIIDLYNKDYFEAALNFPAFVVLFFPHLKLASIGIDIISEVVNYQKSKQPKPPESINLEQLAALLPSSKSPDPTNRSNACKNLGIKEDEIGNKELIDKNYYEMISDLKKRYEGLVTGQSPNFLIAGEIEKLIHNINISYETLKKE